MLLHSLGPNNHPQLLTHPTTDGIMDRDAYRILEYTDLAMTLVPNEESAVNDFMMHLLLVLGYAEMNSGRSVHTCNDIPLYICREWRHAQTDVCVIDRNQNSIILLAQEDKQYFDFNDPIPQLVSGAIAAFQHNNHTQQQSGLPPLNSKVMPGITMISTSLTFSKVRLSTEFVSAIKLGQYPVTPTIVEMHVPVIPRPPCHLSKGMQPLDN
jgi:hypothetical protein